MNQAISEKLSAFFGIKDRLGLVLTGLAAGLALSSLTVVVVFVVRRWGDLGFLRLHYTVALGIDWIADWRYLFVYPGLALLVFGVNSWVTGRLARRSRRLSRLQMVFTALLLALITVGTVLIVSLNG
jgi:hypothetical protein